jgi:hypothetical protein
MSSAVTMGGVSIWCMVCTCSPYTGFLTYTYQVLQHAALRR